MAESEARALVVMSPGSNQWARLQVCWIRQRVQYPGNSLPNQAAGVCSPAAGVVHQTAGVLDWPAGLVTEPLVPMQLTPRHDKPKFSGPTRSKTK